MNEDAIAEVGIDGQDRLYVRPATTSFEYIYRSAMEIHWDADHKRLYGPLPKEWSYIQWFNQILAATADEYGIRLKLDPTTVWSNVPDDLRTKICVAGE